MSFTFLSSVGTARFLALFFLSSSFKMSVCDFMAAWLSSDRGRVFAVEKKKEVTNEKFKDLCEFKLKKSQEYQKKIFQKDNSIKIEQRIIEKITKESQRKNQRNTNERIKD